jgi:hypothetical protein
MPPYHVGSNMAHAVGFDHAEFEHGAQKFQAGTPDVAGPVGLAAAVRFFEEAGHDAWSRHDQALVKHGLERLAAIPRLRLIGPRSADNRVPVFTFVLEGRSPMDVARALDEQGMPFVRSITNLSFLRMSARGRTLHATSTRLALRSHRSSWGSTESRTVGAPDMDAVNRRLVSASRVALEISSHQRFDIPPLTSEEIAVWITTLRGERPSPSELANLLARSGGSPLYLRFVALGADAIDRVELRGGARERA